MCANNQAGETDGGLSLNNMMGAFFALFVGYVLSLTAFIGEKIIYFLSTSSR